MSDADLVRRARGGDRDAFAALIERHHALLLRSCRRMVGAQGAADAAQDAVVTAMLSLDRLRRPEAFGSWLVGIGLNACRAQLRGDSPLYQPAPRGAAEGGLSRQVRVRGSDPLRAADPHESAVASEIASRVRFAIDSLPKGQREAVTLFYLAGLTQAEAAEHLGIPPGAVKTRLHKARASLRARLEPLRKERSMQVEMQVTDVRRAGERHILMLEGGGRELKIWVGPAEAIAIAVLLEDVELPRPGTHHLAAALLRATDASVREVRVTRLAESTFYADIVLADGAEVDARPSDAIALALVTGAPVVVDAAVLDQAERPDPDWAEERAAADASSEGRQVLAAEARERLSRR
jgi:RNA polymerase sigma factor (sigma-70 family)